MRPGSLFHHVFVSLSVSSFSIFPNIMICTSSFSFLRVNRCLCAYLVLPLHPNRRA